MVINNLKREDKIEDFIMNWCCGNESFLNVVAPPYNTSLIFLNTISEYVDKNKRILYITEELQKNLELILYFRKHTKYRGYTYISKAADVSDSNIVFCSYRGAALINSSKFDLVIYDNIRSYPKYSKYEILDVMNKCVKEDGKLIFYSYEEIFYGKRELFIAARDDKNPISEPRVIKTRINLNEDIPFVVYEYLKWSIKINMKVVILVPHYTKIPSVYEYINKYCKNRAQKTLYYSSSEKNERDIKEFTKYKKCIIITDDFDAVSQNNESFNIIAFFADSEGYNYKKFVYLCGRTGRGDIRKRGEVIYLARNETEDIEKAKDITRYFNKIAWEKGLFNY